MHIVTGIGTIYKEPRVSFTKDKQYFTILTVKLDDRYTRTDGKKVCSYTLIEMCVYGEKARLCSILKVHDTIYFLGRIHAQLYIVDGKRKRQNCIYIERLEVINREEKISDYEEKFTDYDKILSNDEIPFLWS